MGIPHGDPKSWPGKDTFKKLDEGYHAELDLSLLQEHPDNPRTITEERFNALKKSLSMDPAMMEARPIIALPDGTVVAGNMRLRALRELGVEKSVVYIRDLTENEQREWMLRDNQEYGDWVPDELASIMEAHRDAGGDMSMLGFEEQQMNALMKADADGDPDAGGGNGGADDSTTADVWGVIVDCDTEKAQEQLMEELAGRGFEARALIP